MGSSCRKVESVEETERKTDRRGKDGRGREREKETYRGEKEMGIERK